MRESRGEEERRKGARPCLEMESLTGILMCLNLCISSVCSPERGVGETERHWERERGRRRERERRVWGWRWNSAVIQKKRKVKPWTDWFHPSILDQNNPWFLGGKKGPGWKKSSPQPSKQAEQAKVQSSTAVSLSLFHLILLQCGAPAHKPLPAPSNK